MTATVFDYLIVISTNSSNFNYLCSSCVKCPLRTLKTVLDHISKHHQARQNTPRLLVAFRKESSTMFVVNKTSSTSSIEPHLLHRFMSSSD